MRNTRGFTLIELLIVVVIIGILAAIAIPKFASTKEKAYIAAMKSDLRNIVTAEEAYFADYVTYGGTTTLIGFTPSTGVSIGAITASGTGWSTTATHVGAAGKTCAIFVGSATPPAPAVNEGEPKCS
ncbi:MAG: prepilin-type N-terminal cleavage/methylation domain-containing protein [Gemmatimonadetes bacterium]|nr:prepilin-type N-terminal cleavage/methylation domain-containing protein [Gemmatimonadota bacterium]